MLKYSRIAWSVDGYGLTEEYQSIYCERPKRRLVFLVFMESPLGRVFKK